MYKDVLEFTYKHWEYWSGYFLVFIALRTLYILKPYGFDFLMIVIFIEFYILSAFLISSSAIIKGNDEINFWNSLIIKNKKLLFEIIILYFFIFIIYYILSLPFIISKLLNIDIISQFLPNNNPDRKILNDIIDVIFRSIYQIILCYSIAFIIYCNESTWNSMKKGIVAATRTKSLLCVIMTFNCFITLTNLMVKIHATEIFINEFLSSLIIPFVVITLFFYFGGNQRVLGHPESAG